MNGKFVAFMAKSLPDNAIDDEMSDQEKDYEKLYILHMLITSG